MNKISSAHNSTLMKIIYLYQTWNFQCLPSFAMNECGSGNSNSDGTDQPWHLIVSDEKDEIHCGATMICSDWAITTASCLRKLGW